MDRFREPVNGFTHLAGAVLAAFALIWMIGAIYKLFFLRTNTGRLFLLCYVLLGSLGIVVLPQALAALPPGTSIFVFASSVTYIVGAVVYGLQRLNFNHLGHHEIWHLLVL